MGRVGGVGVGGGGGGTRNLLILLLDFSSSYSLKRGVRAGGGGGMTHDLLLKMNFRCKQGHHTRERRSVCQVLKSNPGHSSR